MNKLSAAMAALFLAAALRVEAGVVDRVVAQVNDDIITLSDLKREMASRRAQLAQKYSGPELEAEVKKEEKQALDDLIRDKLLLQKANELGFNAQGIDSQVSATIQRVMKENNIKDTQELERALGQQGMTMVAFRDQIRKQIIIDSLIDSFVRSRITLLSSEIEKYYKEHSSEFATAEEVTLSEIIIPVETDEAAARVRAEDIHKRLSQGEAFATLANQYSKGPTAAKGGGIGSYMTAKLNPDVVKAIVKVKEGGISPVTRTKEGFVIYRVDQRKESAKIPIDEVKPQIQQRLFQQKFTPELDRFVAQLKEDAYIQIYGEK